MKRDVQPEEAVIVGGGLAGASAACILARAGRPTLVIEREAGPSHKVCGEFLSIEAQIYLSRLGIDLDALGASRISTIRLMHGGATAQADLPFVARGISRMALDEAVLQVAASHGARMLRGHAVRSVSAHRSGLQAAFGKSGAIHAKTIFLATGKHDVSGVKRPSAGGMDDMIGFKQLYSLEPHHRAALGGSIDVILFEGGYAGLQMIENELANLCLVVTRRCFEQVGRTWDSLLDHVAHRSTYLRDRLDGAVPVFERPLAIFQIPYGYIHRPHSTEPQGLFRLGDQAGVIPSYAGEGMSMALHSGFLAAGIYLCEGAKSSVYHRRIRADIGHQIRLASFLSDMGRGQTGQSAIFRLCRAWPSAMRYVASLTRVRKAAMQRTLLAP